MSFKELYDYIQTKDTCKISRKVILPKVKGITGKNNIKTMYSGMNSQIIRGLYFTPKSSPNSVLASQFKNSDAVIILARDLNYCWQRFIYVKELMHLFDSDKEKTKQQNLEKLLIELCGSVERNNLSEQFKSEELSYWRALSVLCTEKQRQEFLKQKKQNMINNSSIANQLKIPEQHVPKLLGENFKNILKALIND